MHQLTRPWLWLPSQLAHDVGPYALKAITLGRSTNTPEWRPFEWRGLQFKNRLGIAGGVDKTGKSLSAWWKLGPGFIEVGTVTPKEQGPNPGKIMHRQTNAFALWNKMGFPNKGLDVLSSTLSGLPRPYPTPLFVNIGKNRWTENDKAHEDYIACLAGLGHYADVFVINISSPNTKGLRGLQDRDALSAFLEPLVEYKSSQGLTQPFLLKLSPDMSEDELRSTLEVSCEFGLDGFILTNTTQSRPSGINFPAEGGLSGAPLAELSRKQLCLALEILSSRRDGKLIISAGGVTSPTEALARIELGADLIQTYSGIVFGGPFFFLKTLRNLPSD